MNTIQTTEYPLHNMIHSYKPIDGETVRPSWAVACETTMTMVMIFRMLCTEYDFRILSCIVIHVTNFHDPVLLLLLDLSIFFLPSFFFPNVIIVAIGSRTT